MQADTFFICQKVLNSNDKVTLISVVQKHFHETNTDYTDEQNEHHTFTVYLQFKNLL